MKSLNRRQFIKLLMGGLTMSLLGNCSTQESEQGLPGDLVPTSTTSVGPTGTAARPILRSIDAPGFYVRYYRPFKAVDPSRWTLSVEGAVRRPQKLSLSNVLAMPQISQVSRMKCVECWSAAAKWDGIHLSSLMELANPEPRAQWVHFGCADGYYESMPIQNLLQERVVLVHHMNDQILPDDYGAPLRLMVPFRYGYKSAKAIVRIEFAAEELPGYWSTVSIYSKHGKIRPGRDRPLDLQGNRTIPGGAEIFYPDGIESAALEQD